MYFFSYSAQEDINTLERKKSQLEDLLKMKATENAELSRTNQELKQKVEELSGKLEAVTQMAEERKEKCTQLTEKLEKVRSCFVLCRFWEDKLFIICNDFLRSDES